MSYQKTITTGSLAFSKNCRLESRNNAALKVRTNITFIKSTDGACVVGFETVDAVSCANILLAPSGTVTYGGNSTNGVTIDGVSVAEYDPTVNPTKFMLDADDLAWSVWFNDSGVVLSEPSFAAQQIDFKIDRYDPATNQYVEIYDTATSANADSLYVANVTWGDGVSRRSLVDAFPPAESWAHYRARPASLVVKNGLTFAWSEADPTRHVTVWRGTEPPRLVYYYRGAASGSLNEPSDWSLTPDKVVRIDEKPTLKDNRFILNGEGE